MNFYSELKNVRKLSKSDRLVSILSQKGRSFIADPQIEYLVPIFLTDLPVYSHHNLLVETEWLFYSDFLRQRMFPTDERMLYEI